MRAVAAGVYAFTASFAALWWLASPRTVPGYFFQEGGPIDWLSTLYLATAAVLSARVWQASRGDSAQPRWFWLLGAAGFGFFALDERFLFHEQSWRWLRPLLGSAPGGLRNWSDAVVIVYGLVAIVVGYFALPAIFRYRRVWRYLAAAFAFFLLHTLVDSLVAGSGRKDVVEETAKILMGASLVLAYARAAACAEQAERTRVPTTGWPAVIAACASTGLLGTVMIGGNDVWQRTLAGRWGEPTAWLASVLMGIAALLALFAGAKGSLGAGRGRWLLLGVACLAGWLAIDEATLACREVLQPRLFPGVRIMLVSTPLVFHDPSPGGVIAILGIAGILGIVGWPALRGRGPLALLVLPGVLPAVVTAARSVSPSWTALPTVLLLGGCAGCALAGLETYVGRSRELPTPRAGRERREPEPRPAVPGTRTGPPA